MQCTIFGTGPLGLWIANKLVSQGKRVVLVNRSGRLPSYIPSGLQEGPSLNENVKIRAGDACDADQVCKLSAESDVVFHCAIPPYTEWSSKLPSLTEGILDGLARTSAKLIYADNLYMYGNTKGVVIAEESPQRYKGHNDQSFRSGKGRARALAANSILKAHQDGWVSATIGRASDFYGPGVINSALGELFFKSILSGKRANLLGNKRLPHTFTYIKDFANALVTLSEHDKALGQVWHVPSAPTITMDEFARLVAAELNRPVKTRSFGRFSVSLLGLVNDMIREQKEMMYAWERPYIVSHEKFERAFGTHITPHDQAIRETLEWYSDLVIEDKNPQTNTRILNEGSV